MGRSLLPPTPLVNEDAINPKLLTLSLWGAAPDNEELARYFEPLSIPNTYPAVLRRMSRRIVDSDPTGAPTRTTVIWGENDAWVPLRHAEEFIQKHPEVTDIQIIPESGPQTPWTPTPNELNTLLLDPFDP